MANCKVRLIANKEVVAEFNVLHAQVSPAQLIAFNGNHYHYHRLCGTAEAIVAEFMLADAGAILNLTEEDKIK